jgi:Na+-driven multidrug efflux pump
MPDRAKVIAVVAAGFAAIVAVWFATLALCSARPLASHDTAPPEQALMLGR